MYFRYWKKFLEENRIPSNADSISRKKRIKNEIRFLKRYLFFLFSGQIFRVRKRVGNSKRLLIFANSNNSLGDSLMDLAPRVLLKDFEVDLYIQSGNRVLFSEDPYFSKVFSDLREAGNYDLILLDQSSSKSLKEKIRFFPKTPFIPIQGFFYGFQFNRTLFHFARYEEFLGVEAEKRTHLFYDFQISKKNYVSIAIGGNDPERTYHRWSEVVELLDDEVVLVGSSNGVSEAEEIENRNPKVKNLVGKLSLKESAKVVGSSKLLICADGGIMHIALALEVPVIALFIEPFRPEYRFINSKNIGIYKRDISEIEPEEIVEKYPF